MLTTDVKLGCLKSCALFSKLPQSTLGVLAEAMEEERFDDGEVVCLHGEEADRVYVVHEGRLAVVLPGATAPVRHLDRGEILGEYGMFRGTRTTSIYARGATALLSLDYARFRSFLFQYPAAMHDLLAVTVDRLVEAEARARR